MDRSRTHSLATATQLQSGLSATSLTGNVVLTRISSSLLFSKEYLHTVPSSDPAMKKSFYAVLSSTSPIAVGFTYTSSNSGVILLAIIDSNGLIRRSGTEDTAKVVDSDSDQLLPIRGIGQESRTGSI